MLPTLYPALYIPTCVKPRYDSIKKRSIIPIVINKIVAGKKGNPKRSIFLYNKKSILLKLINLTIIGINTVTCTIDVNIKAYTAPILDKL